jgi:hypothetical protein
MDKDLDLDYQYNQEQANISLGEIFKKQRISKKIDLAKASEFLKVRNIQPDSYALLYNMLFQFSLQHPFNLGTKKTSDE